MILQKLNMATLQATMRVSTMSRGLSNRRMSMHKWLFTGSSSLALIPILRIATLLGVHAIGGNVMVWHIEEW